MHYVYRIGSGARWRHRGAMQDALGGTLRTFLEAGNGPPPLRFPHLALLGRNPGPAPPNQPPLPPNADRGGTARALPKQRGTFPSAGLRLCSTRRFFPSSPRHGASKGSPLLVQGRRWVMVAPKNHREHYRGQKYTWSAFGTTRDRLKFLFSRRATRLRQEPYEALGACKFTSPARFLGGSNVT